MRQTLVQAAVGVNRIGMDQTNNLITRDLMDKVAKDVGGAIKRTLSIAPPPTLPVALCATAAALGYVTAILAQMTDDYDPSKPPYPDTILLAGLLSAHCAIGGSDSYDGIHTAYEDFRKLRPLPTSEAKP